MRWGTKIVVIESPGAVRAAGYNALFL